MIVWLTATSSSQFEPRTENSTGKPRWAVKPCWERSWMTARSPGMEFSSRRRTAENSAWLSFRSLGRDDGHEQIALVDAAAESADEAEELGDLGPAGRRCPRPSG